MDIWTAKKKMRTFGRVFPIALAAFLNITQRGYTLTFDPDY